MTANHSTFPGLVRPVGIEDRKRSLVERGSLGARYGLDVDAAASAAVSVLPSAERPSVESCFEFLAVLLLPLVHGDTVLLLYPVSVPFGYDVERAEGNDSHVRCQVVNVAALWSLFVLVVFVLEVHHSEEHALDVELSDCAVVVFEQGSDQQLCQVESRGLLVFLNEAVESAHELGCN